MVVHISLYSVEANAIAADILSVQVMDLNQDSQVSVGELAAVLNSSIQVSVGGCEKGECEG